MQREQDDEGYGYGREREEERVEPPEGRQQATDSRVARRPDGEDAGVVAEGARALLSLVDVADHGDVERPKRRGTHSLAKAEREEQLEAAGEGASGKAEEEERGDQYLLPPVAVGEHAEERGLTMPGRVKNVIRSPTCPLEIPRSLTMVGKAGVTLEVPRTAINVTPHKTWRLWSL